MTDPTTPQPVGGDPVPENVLGARVAAGGAGATDVDVNQLLAAITQMQARVDALEAEKSAASAPALLSSAQSLAAILANHTHAPLAQAATDLVDAASNAVKSGDASYVRKIAADISKLLHRNAPPPGDNHNYQHALDFAEVHVPDAADALPAPSRQALAGNGGQATQVVAGHVTG